MSKALSDFTADEFLSLLVISPSGGGKTHLAGTAIEPIHVIYSDNNESKIASMVRSAGRKVVRYSIVNSTVGAKLLAQYEEAFTEISRGVADGKIKSVVWDTISNFCALLCNAELQATIPMDKPNNAPNGKIAYDAYARRMMSLTGRFLALKCHRIAMSHYAEQSREMDGQLDKEGDGIVPGVPGRVRQELPRDFENVVYLRKQKKSEDRELVCSMVGVFGPRVNDLHGIETIPADLAGMVERLKAARKSGGKTPTTAQVVKVAKQLGTLVKPPAARPVR